MNRQQVSQIVGYTGGMLVISLNIPLLVKTIKEKSTHSLSLASLLLHLITSFTYIAYGILIKELPVILCNLAYTIITLILILVKIVYDRKNKNIILPDPNMNTVP